MSVGCVWLRRLLQRLLDGDRPSVAIADLIVSLTELAE